MSDVVFTHDSGVEAFEDAGGVVDSSEGDIEFTWDERHVVTVDAPANLGAAFDTDEFYKIDGATIARPIKQVYVRDDELQVYKKPAEELDRAAWTFDNAPFTLDHPETGMVKAVDDIHGFWRNPRYDHESDRLKEDLYVPTTDEEAIGWIEENEDVSVGFYNRVHSDYDGNTGTLTDDDVDGFQVDIYGNHVAGVENGRCSDEDGCGLDHSGGHGAVVDALTVDPPTQMTTDAPSGIYVADDGTWLAVSPSEHSKESTEHPDDAMFPVDSCSDVEDAWGLRGHTDNLDISKETLANRIERVDGSKDCGVVSEESEDSDPSDTEDCSCGQEDNMTEDNENDFDVPDLSIDALAEKNEAVGELRERKDELESQVEEMEDEIVEAFDEADKFSVELEDDECPCEAVSDLVSDLDQKAVEVEDLRDELQEYRQEEIDEKLDRLTELGAEREEWEDEELEDIETEIDRREEVAEDLGVDATVKDIEPETDSGDDEDEVQADDTSIDGRRKFGRGFGA